VNSKSHGKKDKKAAHLFYKNMPDLIAMVIEWEV
jgi:hypothetical protein